MLPFPVPQFEQAFPDHRTVLLPGASHFIQEDAGEQIAAEFKNFRATHPGGSS